VPQNLRFTAGLEHWSLRGSFLQDPGGRHWQDYACGTGPGPDAASAGGYLRAQAPRPAGFADLRQAIMADAYRGRRIRVSADLKTVDATGKAGLYLRVIDPARSRPPEVREQLSLSGSTVWTRRHVEAEVRRAARRPHRRRRPRPADLTPTALPRPSPSSSPRLAGTTRL
jgi:hypothetical protein